MKDVAYDLTAIRQMRKLSATTRKRITAKIDRYAKTGAGDVKPLTGGGSRKRLRDGDYRVVFTETATSINVLLVAHRKEIY